MTAAFLDAPMDSDTQDDLPVSTTKQELTEPQRLWIEALRSGHYQQGYGCLNDWTYVDNVQCDCYCCLGVACMVAEQHGIEVDRNFSSEQVLGNTFASQPAVQEWLGIATIGGGIRDYDHTSEPNYCRSLWQMNDSRQYSFAAIADFLEEHPEQVFVPPGVSVITHANLWDSYQSSVDSQADDQADGLSTEEETDLVWEDAVGLGEFAETPPNTTEIVAINHSLPEQMLCGETANDEYYASIYHEHFDATV
jgi:hypothetical protein